MLGVIQGDFIREPAGGLTVAGQVVGGFIPGMDFRDIYANLKHGDLGMAALSAIGLMPGVGDAVKSADTIIKFIVKNADNVDEVVKILKIVGANWSEVAKLLGKSDEFKTAMKGMLTNPDIKFTKGQFDALMDLLKKADLEELADEATNPDIMRFLGKGGSDVLDNFKPQNLMDELASSGVKYNPDEVIAVTKTVDGKLLWLEQGNAKSGLIHILARHVDDFASQGIDDIPKLLTDVLKTTPVNMGSNSKGLFADYVFNENIYRVAYGTNGYIVSFYPID